jgi:transposase
MSIAVLIQSVRRPGRPRVQDDPAERQKHIRCTTLLLRSKATAEELAGMFDVSVRTVYNWRDLALGYDEPEAEGLRRMPGRGR